jgi:hypothetical protein
VPIKLFSRREMVPESDGGDLSYSCLELTQGTPDIQQLYNRLETARKNTLLEIGTVMHACMRVVDVIFSSLGAQYMTE